MTTVHSEKDIEFIDNGNMIIGDHPELVDSEIVFNGNDNVLICEEGVCLCNSSIKFDGNNSIVYLGSGNGYRVDIVTYHNSVCSIGRGTYFNPYGKLSIVLSENTHCIIGFSCLISYGISIRNADPHLIYDVKTLKRLNYSKSIYIGDHVWIGQDALILKGTQIDSGSIIGGNAVVAGKHIPCNTSWAGNPARQIAEGVFWDPGCVHKWCINETKASEDYAEYLKKISHDNTSVDQWIYNYDENVSLNFDSIENSINEANTLRERMILLVEINKNVDKNRFVHKFDV